MATTKTVPNLRTPRKSPSKPAGDRKGKKGQTVEPPADVANAGIVAQAKPIETQPTNPDVSSATPIPSLADAFADYCKPAVVPVVGKVSHAYGTPGNTGTARTRDVPVCPDKLSVFAALLALGATDASRAVSSKQTVDAAYDRRLGAIDAWCVQHYSYHGAAAGLVSVVERMFGRGHGFALTPAGVDYLQKHNAELAKQATSKPEA